MLDHGLSPKQVEVINALSAGATITGAAAQVGVHRNTISLWRRNLIHFQQALTHAEYDRAIYFREKTEALADLAVDALRRALTDEKTPAGTRVRAALAILNTITSPPEPKKQIMLDIQKLRVRPDEAQNEAQNDAQNESQPDDSQSASEPPIQPAAEAYADCVHNIAQSTRVETIRRNHPKIGRNDQCPCGSGLKHKRCCQNKAAA
jgi:transposase-like protein